MNHKFLYAYPYGETCRFLWARDWTWTWIWTWAWLTFFIGLIGNWFYGFMVSVFIERGIINKSFIEHYLGSKKNQRWMSRTKIGNVCFLLWIQNTWLNWLMAFIDSRLKSSGSHHFGQTLRNLSVDNWFPSHTN